MNEDLPEDLVLLERLLNELAPFIEVEGATWTKGPRFTLEFSSSCYLDDLVRRVGPICERLGRINQEQLEPIPTKGELLVRKINDICLHFTKKHAGTQVRRWVDVPLAWGHGVTVCKECGDVIHRYTQIDY